MCVNHVRYGSAKAHDFKKTTHTEFNLDHSMPSELQSRPHGKGGDKCNFHQGLDAHVSKITKHMLFHV